MARVTLGHKPELVGGDRRLRITPTERLILLVVMGRPLATRYDLVEILWPNPDNQPDHWSSSISVGPCWSGKAAECGWRRLNDNPSSLPS